MLKAGPYLRGGSGGQYPTLVRLGVDYKEDDVFEYAME